MSKPEKVCGYRATVHGRPFTKYVVFGTLSTGETSIIDLGIIPPHGFLTKAISDPSCTKGPHTQRVHVSSVSSTPIGYTVEYW